jgi:hypothetical protein
VEADVKMNFGEFEGARTAAPFDYGTLCASLNVAQAASPTARLATLFNDGCGAPVSSIEHAIILFRTEQDWEHSLAAMHGNFHAAAAMLLVENAL